MSQNTTPIAHPFETGKLGIYYLKRIWSVIKIKRQKGSQSDILETEWTYTNAVCNTLGIGLEPTLKYLYAASPSFEDFENWIIKYGRVSKPIIEHFNEIIDKVYESHSSTNGIERPFDPVLTLEDLNQWEQEGYVIIENAISKEDCEKTRALIYNFIGASEDDPKTWYLPQPAKQGIMVQLFNHEILDKNRLSNKIRIAYQQLWHRRDLMVSMDRVSFNPPETDHYQFQGPNLHWDVSLKTPIPYGLQGLLYLSDTLPHQGAFTLVPGFHKRIGSWLRDLPENANPRQQDLAKLGTKAIAAKAGDFVIWNQTLPHGSAPNYAKLPRIVQYINYQPITLELQKEWI